MNTKRIGNVLATALMAAGLVQGAHAAVPGIYITEFMGNSGPAQHGYVEITNLTGWTVDLTEYGFFKDSMGGTGPVSYVPPADENGFGTWQFNADMLAQINFSSVKQGESVILTTACNSAACYDDEGEPDFHAIWDLPDSVKVQNLGEDYSLVPTTSSQLSIYRLADGALIDQVNYSTALAKSGFSANADHGALGAPFDATGWMNSSVGDSFQSKVSLANEDLGLDGGAIGNPGFYASPAPEPETYAMMLAGLGLVFMAKRRRKES